MFQYRISYLKPFFMFNSEIITQHEIMIVTIVTYVDMKYKIAIYVNL